MPEQSNEFAASYAQQYANQHRPNGTFHNVDDVTTQAQSVHPSYGQYG